MLTEIVKRALTETVINIGQLTPAEVRQLNVAVKRGYLSRGVGGPFPRMKTIWARPDFDFAADREREVAEAMRLSEWESRHRQGQPHCLNLQCRHGIETAP